MLILNSGGTFNKRYNEISGHMEVPYDNKAIEEIMSAIKQNYRVAGILYKDSLEMDNEDRKRLADVIASSTERAFVIVHGTDTIDKTAEFLDTVFEKRIIVLTGAMKPYFVEKAEASFNLGMAIGFIKAEPSAGVYICMNGHLVLWNKICKNRELGKFQIV